MCLLTAIKNMKVLPMPNPILSLIYQSSFPLFSPSTVFIKHLLYARNLVSAKGIFAHLEPVLPSGGRITMLRMGAQRQAGPYESQGTTFYFKFNVRPSISFKEGGTVILFML